MTLEGKSALNEFADAARRYCEWTELSQSTGVQALHEVQLLLGELHFRANRLPELEVSENEEITEESRPVEIYEEICRRYSERLPFSDYFVASEPLDYANFDKPETSLGWLADDLRDIYIDLKKGLEHFVAGRMIEANWDWRFQFIHHWGEHATGALYAIWQYLREHSSVESGDTP